MLQSYYQQEFIEAGCDEAGRGCLAGPVVAAAVIFPKNFHHPLINDSKKLSASKRVELRSMIEHHALAYQIKIVDVATIDKINILNASILAMHKSLEELSIRPEYIIVDGNRFKKFQNLPHTCIVKGDSKYLSIAAASILAKTYRDELMERLSEEYPMYGWKKNKGYGTLDHRKALLANGYTEHHRKSFKLKEMEPILF